MRKNYIKKIITHEEWLKEKEKTIGGSEAAAIIGKSKWLTPNDLYNKLALGKTKNLKSNSKMEEGVIAEPHIRALFANDCKEFIVQNPPTRKAWLFIRKDKPYLSCTPDGLLTKKENGALWGYEAKNVDLIKTEDKREWEANIIPDQYLYQIIHDLVVINDMEGMVINAHLKYYKRVNDTYVFDYAVDKYLLLYRDEIKGVISYLENQETNFMENNVMMGNCDVYNN